MLPEKFVPSRAIQPAILTALSLALGGVFAIYFAWSYVAMYMAILPVPLLMLWLTSQVEDPAVRIAAADAAAHAGA